MEGISKFPYFHKFYLMLGQLNERQGKADGARAAYQDGLKRCMTSVPLWRSLSRLEEGAGMVGKARNVLEQVRHSLPVRGMHRWCTRFRYIEAGTNKAPLSEHLWMSAYSLKLDICAIV